MKVRDMLKRLKEDGWRLDRTRGDHKQYTHPVKPGTVTVPGHEGDDLTPGTLNSILKQAGLK
jgi:predicted RNA binding protein YcfA (HicA-like mRNA interferase family)